MGLRADLAAHLAGELDGVAVHESPAEVTAVPAVVIHPAPGEYWVPFTLGRSGTPGVAWALVVEVLVARTDPRAGLDAIELLAAEAVRAMAAFPSMARFQSLSDIGEVTVGDSPALSAQISMLVPYPLPESP